jgi:S-adenosylmethionine-dependent methyltransferase
LIIAEGTGRAPGRPRLAELLRQVRMSLRAVPAPGEVVDVGGGTGSVAVQLAADGHSVTVLDSSAAMLATCVERAAELGVEVGERLRTVQGDAEQAARLLGAAAADGVLCHGVLEVVRDPQLVLAGLARLLRPGGVLSLVVANRSWLAQRAARRGDYREALRLLDEPWVQPAPAGRGARERHRTAGPARAWTAAELRPWCAAAGLELTAEYGLQAFAEPPPDADRDQLDALLELERRAAERQPFRSVGEFLHLVARRGGEPA